MKTLDWIFIIGSLALVFGIGAYTYRYMKSVASFVSGGRFAGRYLLAVARGEMMAGAVNFVALFEVFSRAGFTVTYWRWIEYPILVIVSITGFVIYRYRETRAMTLAQFFEVRYSKRFRLFTGALAFLAGIFNFGIIPAVGARFFVYFIGLPPTLQVWGTTIPTFAVVMAVLLSLVVLLTISGGLITVMVTDCIEGMLSQVFYIAIIAALIFTFNWSDVTATLSARSAGASMLNPYDSFRLEDFNIWWVLMSIFVTTYGTMAWQNASAYNAAAHTPHEARMGMALGRWRDLGRVGVVTMLAVCAVTFLEHPSFASGASHVDTVLSGIAQDQVRHQMRVPIALSELLPTGIKGIFCVILLMGIFGGDSTHLHSWSGILVQDIVVPLRKKPFTPQAHIRALRLAVIGVAVFAFLFGLFFQQTEYIVMWWQVTMAIYVGGAGAAIIGGLYWKKGTAAGAWAALLTGSTLSVAGILARQIFRSEFPLNGMQISFCSTLTAITVYVVVSLLTCKEDFNLDRMLHRGRYALDADGKPAPTPAKRKLSWAMVLGIDENFRRGDKFIAGWLFFWCLTWALVVAVLSVWNWIHPLPVVFWEGFWLLAGVGVPILIAAITAVWFTWGGLNDLRRLFQRLAAQKVNHLDNGTVVAGQNLDDLARSNEDAPEPAAGGPKA